MILDDMWDNDLPPGVQQDKTGEMWQQARGELLGFANHLERQGATITAQQLRLAVVRSDCLDKMIGEQN